MIRTLLLNPFPYPELPRLTSPSLPSLRQMTFTGSTAKPQFMGMYERSEKTAHGAPVFVKKDEGTTYYLNRYTDGIWRVASEEKNIATGASAVKASKPADLPSEASLSWAYWDGKAMQDDPAMTCAAGEEAAAAWVEEQEAEVARIAAAWANASDKVGFCEGEGKMDQRRRGGY